MKEKKKNNHHHTHTTKISTDGDERTGMKKKKKKLKKIGGEKKKLFLFAREESFTHFHCLMVIFCESGGGNGEYYSVSVIQDISLIQFILVVVVTSSNLE